MPPKCALVTYTERTGEGVSAAPGPAARRQLPVHSRVRVPCGHSHVLCPGPSRTPPLLLLSLLRGPSSAPIFNAHQGCFCTSSCTCLPSAAPGSASLDHLPGAVQADRSPRQNEQRVSGDPRSQGRSGDTQVLWAVSALRAEGPRAAPRWGSDWGFPPETGGAGRSHM